MQIQKLRLQRGWSQQQLAEFSGLSTRTIQRLENGQTASLESLKALAAVFEVEISQLQGASKMTTQTESLSIPTVSLSEKEEGEALRHVRAVKRFYSGWVLYTLVIGVLALVNWLHTPQTWWVQWPALIWGILLLGRALRTFNVFFDPVWEKRQVEKCLQRRL